MALSDGDRADLMRRWVQREFVEANSTANLDTVQVRAAVNALDDLLDAQASTLTQNRTVGQNMLDVLPEPFKSSTNMAQKTLVLAFVAMKRGGVI